ncbi:alkaline phosphatase family protein [Segatella baroniae]|uniref:alkaline phosphatase family protein n=1 Tax=Segatella baroniae TaxID=305719 RepID=UPI000409238F|nr:alkaline phosphatase family protein [Segatella baroniae]
MKKLFALVLLAVGSLAAVAQVARPKLVVGLVVDQMRWDYLYYYYDKFGTDGLRRLVDRGYSFENTMINYVPTVTAIGHASIYTGSVPALTGIAGNNFFENGESKYCVGDPTVKSVGCSSGAGRMSPRNLWASTMGDELRIATDFKSKVIGVALKDRAAILPAGHSANAAYWWDTKAGHFVTSTFYRNELPDWVVAFNRKYRQKPGTEVKLMDLGVTLTFKMAEAVLENEQLGQDDVTDLLAVSISSTDAIGHQYSTRGPENESVYLQLDRDLAAFFKVLDEKVGEGNYLFFLTADHGGAHNPNFMKRHGIPAGGFEGWTIGGKDLNAYLQQACGTTAKLVTGCNSFRVYLDHKAIAEAGLDLQQVKDKASAWLLQRPEVMYVADQPNIASQTIPQPIKERIINGWNAKRSGDLFIVTAPGWLDATNAPDYKGTGHSQWNPYDAHIPFVLYGWNVKPGSTSEPTRIVDIAPTVCAMLHIQMPNACVGDAKQIK